MLTKRSYFNMNKVKNEIISNRIAPVPRDQILKARGGFPKLDRQRIVSNFRKLHELSELVYNGDGSWGKGCADVNVFDNVKTNCSKSLMRMSYTRLSAYLAMRDCDDSGLYLQRAKQAADFLMREQRPDGYFPYYLDDSGWPLFDSHGIMYVTGFAARALLDLYDYCGDEKYLNSVYRACLWASKFPSTRNYNYNSILIGMLARMSVLLKDNKHLSKICLPDYQHAMSAKSSEIFNFSQCFLSQAVNKTIFDILSGQQPNGGYLEHNSQIWYHGIITAANALVLKAISPSHQNFNQIMEALIGNINYFVANQSPDGSLYTNYKVTHTAAAYSFWVLDALFESRSIVGNVIDDLLSGIANQFLNEVEAKPGYFYNPEKKTDVNCISNHLEGLSTLYSMTFNGF